jgi:electron transport complex protein RnfE
LLATTTTATNGLGMGLATTTVLVLSNATISLIRNLVRPEVRLPVFVLVIASFVTAVELTMQAQFYELYLVLGLFIPLIVTNCAIIGRAEAYASKARLDKAILDGLAMGVGFTLVLMVLGGMRELLGQGTLFYQAHLLLGAGAQGFGLDLGEDFQGALLAILPPGAFIGLGFLIALKNLIDKRVERRRAVHRASSPEPVAQASTGDVASARG